MCRIEFGPSPRVRFRVPHISKSRLLTTVFGVCQSSHEINSYNIHYLDFETRLKTIRHTNDKRKEKNNKLKNMHKDEAVPESRLGLPLLLFNINGDTYTAPSRSRRAVVELHSRDAWSPIRVCPGHPFLHPVHLQGNKTHCGAPCSQ